jgi:hypothetical protein
MVEGRGVGGSEGEWEEREGVGGEDMGGRNMERRYVEEIKGNRSP